MTDEIKQPEQSEVLPPEGEKPEESPFTFLEYLDSDRGHEIAKTILGLWKELQQATLGSKSDETKEQLRRQHEAWRLGVTLQTALGAVVIITAGGLAGHSKNAWAISRFPCGALRQVPGRKNGQIQKPPHHVPHLPKRGGHFNLHPKA